MNYNLISRILLIASWVLRISAILLIFLCILISLHIIPVSEYDWLYLGFSIGFTSLANIFNIIRSRIKNKKENSKEVNLYES